MAYYWQPLTGLPPVEVNTNQPPPNQPAYQQPSLYPYPTTSSDAVYGYQQPANDVFIFGGNSSLQRPVAQVATPSQHAPYQFAAGMPIVTGSMSSFASSSLSSAVVTSGISYPPNMTGRIPLVVSTPQNKRLLTPSPRSAPKPSHSVEYIYNKFVELLKKHGSLEVTSQYIVNQFVQLSVEDRKMIKEKGHIRNFLALCPYIEVENDLLKLVAIPADPSESPRCAPEDPCVSKVVDQVDASPVSSDQQTKTKSVKRNMQPMFNDATTNSGEATDGSSSTSHQETAVESKLDVAISVHADSSNEDVIRDKGDTSMITAQESSEPAEMITGSTDVSCDKPEDGSGDRISISNQGDSGESSSAHGATGSSVSATDNVPSDSCNSEFKDEKEECLSMYVYEKFAKDLVEVVINTAKIRYAEESAIACVPEKTEVENSMINIKQKGHPNQQDEDSLFNVQEKEGHTDEERHVNDRISMNDENKNSCKSILKSNPLVADKEKTSNTDLKCHTDSAKFIDYSEIRKKFEEFHKLKAEIAQDMEYYENGNNGSVGEAQVGSESRSMIKTNSDGYDGKTTQPVLPSDENNTQSLNSSTGKSSSFVLSKNSLEFTSEADGNIKIGSTKPMNVHAKEFSPLRAVDSLSSATSVSTHQEMNVNAKMFTPSSYNIKTPNSFSTPSNAEEIPKFQKWNVDAIFFPKESNFKPCTFDSGGERTAVPDSKVEFIVPLMRIVEKKITDEKKNNTDYLVNKCSDVCKSKSISVCNQTCQTQICNDFLERATNTDIKNLQDSAVNTIIKKQKDGDTQTENKELIRNDVITQTKESLFNPKSKDGIKLRRTKDKLIETDAVTTCTVEVQTGVYGKIFSKDKMISTDLSMSEIKHMADKDCSDALARALFAEKQVIELQRQMCIRDLKTFDREIDQKYQSQFQGSIMNELDRSRLQNGYFDVKEKINEQIVAVETLSDSNIKALNDGLTLRELPEVSFMYPPIPQRLSNRIEMSCSSAPSIWPPLSKPPASIPATSQNEDQISLTGSAGSQPKENQVSPPPSIDSGTATAKDVELTPMALFESSQMEKRRRGEVPVYVPPALLNKKKKEKVKNSIMKKGSANKSTLPPGVKFEIASSEIEKIEQRKEPQIAENIPETASTNLEVGAEFFANLLKDVGITLSPREAEEKLNEYKPLLDSMEVVILQNEPAIAVNQLRIRAMKDLVGLLQPMFAASALATTSAPPRSETGSSEISNDEMPLSLPPAKPPATVPTRPPSFIPPNHSIPPPRATNNVEAPATSNPFLRPLLSMPPPENTFAQAPPPTSDFNQPFTATSNLILPVTSVNVSVPPPGITDKPPVPGVSLGRGQRRNTSESSKGSSGDTPDTQVSAYEGSKVFSSCVASNSNYNDSRMFAGDKDSVPSTISSQPFKGFTKEKSPGDEWPILGKGRKVINSVPSEKTISHDKSSSIGVEASLKSRSRRRSSSRRRRQDRKRSTSSNNRNPSTTSNATQPGSTSVHSENDQAEDWMQEAEDFPDQVFEFKASNANPIFNPPKVNRSDDPDKPPCYKPVFIPPSPPTQNVHQKRPPTAPAPTAEKKPAASQHFDIFSSAYREFNTTSTLVPRSRDMVSAHFDPRDQSPSRQCTRPAFVGDSLPLSKMDALDDFPSLSSAKNTKSTPRPSSPPNIWAKAINIKKEETKQNLAAIRKVEKKTVTAADIALNAGNRPSQLCSLKQKPAEEEKVDKVEPPKEDVWQTVGAKTKPRKTKLDSEQARPNTKSTKSTNFERLLERFFDAFPGRTREELQGVIHTIRENHGSLKGIPLQNLLSEAGGIFKQRNCMYAHSEEERQMSARNVPPRLAAKQQKQQQAVTAPQWTQHFTAPVAANQEIYLSDDDEESDQCSICLDSLNDGQRLDTLACGHVFHQKCILLWHTNSTTCPNCRTHAPSEVEYPPLA